ncbi:MAG: O-antigen ligase family protein [Phycisphaerae bacterium]
MQRLIETLSLFILIGVAILRPLVGESYDSSGTPFTQALGAVGDPSPLRTLVFDLLILLAACGWLLARCSTGWRPVPHWGRLSHLSFDRLESRSHSWAYRWTGLEWGAGLVAIAAIISCFFAGNKRLAINATIDWLCLPVLAIALVQLMYQPWHRRLLLAAVLASACVQAAQCVEQHFVGFDETWEHYQSIKDEFWASQGVDLDSAKVEMFERRIQAREATGFLPHSNITGSYLVLCGMAAIAIVIATWRRCLLTDWKVSPTGCKDGSEPRLEARTEARAINRLVKTGSMLAAALILTAAILTKSVGALTAGVAGIALWLVSHLFRPWINARRTKLVVIGWVCAAAGLLAVVGHGLRHDSLPGWSLTFRWHYWRASAELIADHAGTGVGRENFGRHYLRYKPIESPEEVANPHSLFVQAAADWGLLGFVGIMAMMVGASLVIAKPPTARPPPVGSSDATPNRWTIIAWMVALTLVVILCRLPLLGTNDPNFLYYATVTTGLWWVLGFICFAFDGVQRTSQAGTSARLVGTGVVIGLFTFLLHDMINFAMFVPGTATTLFAFLAFCIAEQTAEKHPTRTYTAMQRWLPVGVLTAALIAVIFLGILPVARSAYYLRLARQTGQYVAPVPLTAQVANHYFQRAATLDPLDPTPYVERAEWLMYASTIPELRDDAFRLAGESLALAAHRDPFSLRLRRMKMQLYQAKASATEKTEDYLAAIEAAREALKLYPLDPRGLVALADCQLEAGEATRSIKLLHEAIENYERALKLDDARPAWGKLPGFRPKERQAIELKIHRAQRLLP